MVNWIRINNQGLTNFTPGSVIRTILESISLEIEALYFQLHKGFRWALENSVLNTFGFSMTEATHAKGTVTLELYNTLDPIVIPKGTIFYSLPNGTTDILEFETTESVVVPVLQEKVKIAIRCITPGEEGNLPANYVRVAKNPQSYYKNIYNEEALNGGTLAETTEQRKARFAKFIKSLSKGTKSALEYGALEVQPTSTDPEGVAGVYVLDSIGIVTLYVHDEKGFLSERLRTRVLENIEYYRSAGVEVEVKPVTTVYVDIKIQVTLIDDNANKELYRTHVLNSVIKYLNMFPVGKSLIKADLIRFIMSIGSGVVFNTHLDLEDDIMHDNTPNLIRAGKITVTIDGEV